MKFDAALVKEQGVEFAVVCVKRSAFNSTTQRPSMQAQFSRAFGGVPTVLMAERSDGKPEYWGRPDLVRWLSEVPYEMLPWAKYSLS